MLEQIGIFIQKYFIDPVTYGTGYNIYNTLTYAAILIVAALLVYKMLKYMKIKIDNKFLFGIIPYIVLGGLLRALEDAAVVGGALFKTPLLYFLVFVTAIVSLAVSLIVQKYSKIRYNNVWFAIGVIILIPCFAFVKFLLPFALISIVGLTIFFVFSTIAVKKIAIMKKIRTVVNFLSNENLLLINTHLFDASTTFTATNFFPYYEQHVLPGYLIGEIGPIVMFPLKLAVISLVLYVLDRELNKKDDIEKRNFIKLLILILGLAPGLRNLLRLIMAV